jgi:molybdopterin converting factor subunit 1
MTVKVLYFGQLKELAGVSEESVELPDGSVIAQLFEHCSSNRPAIHRFRASLQASHNLELAPWDTPLRQGDEVGFLPPVSGG